MFITSFSCMSLKKLRILLLCYFLYSKLYKRKNFSSIKEVMNIKNQLKTVLLLGGLTGLLLLIGGFAGGRTGLTIAIVLAGGMNFVSYWWSDKIVLWMYKAKEADKNKYVKLYSIVKEITTKAHLPMPKVYIVDTPQSNA